MKRWYIGTGAMLLGAASYGISGPFAKLAYMRGITIGELVPSMFLISSILFSVIMLFNPRRFEGMERKHPWQLLCLGGIGIGGTIIFYYTAINHLPVSVAIVLLFQFAWIVPFLNFIFNRSWPNMYVALSLILIMSGTQLAVGLSWGFWREGTLVGYITGFISAWCYAIYLQFNAVVATKVPALTRSAFMCIGGLIVVLVVYPPLYFFNGRVFELGILPLLSSLFNQIIPTLFMAIGIPIIGGVLSAILGSIELPVSVLSSNLMLNEPVTPVKWMGIFLILSGIILAGTLGNREVTKKSTAKRSSHLN